MTNNTRSILTNALEMLGSNGENWIKNAASEGPYKVCLRTAIIRSASKLELGPIEGTKAKFAVSKILDSLNREPCIPLYNDDPNTTFKDIKFILETTLADDLEEVPNDGAGD
jgi:hypothetical protein